MLERFCTIFSTPERPLPQFYYFDASAIAGDYNIALKKHFPDKRKIDSIKLKDVIREQVILQAALDFELVSQPLEEEEKLARAKLILGQKEVIYLDEAGELRGPSLWEPGDRIKTLLPAIEVLKELCPKAIIFVTSGHGFTESSSIEEYFCNLYKENIARPQPLKMFERGLRDAWNTDAAMVAFFGLEKAEVHDFALHQDLETFQAWLVNRVTAGLRGYFNPFILERYFESYTFNRRQFAETACQKIEAREEKKLTDEEHLQITTQIEANFEKAIASLNRLDISTRQGQRAKESSQRLLADQFSPRQEARKATPVRVPLHRLYWLENPKIRAVATEYKLDPEDFLQTVRTLRDYFDELYKWAITDVLSSDALTEKLKIAETTETTLVLALLYAKGERLKQPGRDGDLTQKEQPTPEEVLGEEQRKKQKEEVLTNFLQILAKAEFSLRAIGAGKDYPEILLPEPQSED